MYICTIILTNIISFDNNTIAYLLSLFLDFLISFIIDDNFIINLIIINSTLRL